MNRKSTNTIFSAIIILILTMVPIAQAAPPADGPITGISFGETLNFEEAESSTGYNLGAIMSDQAAPPDDGDGTDDGPDDAGDNNGDDVDDEPTDNPDGDNSDDQSDDPDDDDDASDDDDDQTGDPDDDDDDDQTDDPDGDDDDDDGDDGNDDDDGDDDNNDDTAAGTENPDWQHPVATKISEYFVDASYEEVMGYHTEGNGFGNIARAYYFGQELGLEPAQLLSDAHDMGWGNVLRENGIHPGAIGHGGMQQVGQNGSTSVEESATFNGPPGQNRRANPSELTGQGGPNGNGNGRGLGNGNRNGNGNGNGNGRGVTGQPGNGHGGGNGNGPGNGNGGGNGNGHGRGGNR